MKRVVIYTDGSCLRNPGPGGWAAVLTLPGSAARKEICGGCRLTTNNRMEIMGALRALQHLKEPCEVELYTDSRYLCDAVGKGWLASWQSRAWRKADKKPVLNRDLWLELLAQLERHRVRMLWLEGHAGHAENERCDCLARREAGRPDLPEDAGYADNKVPPAL